MTGMPIWKSRLVCLPLLLFLSDLANSADTCDTDTRKYHPGHYVSPNNKSRNSSFSKLLVPGTQGLQLRYRWADLEPEPGQYTLNEIAAALDELNETGGQLVVLIEDKSFDGKIPTPEYLHKYTVQNRNRGYTLKRWDPFAVERMNALIAEIGKQFDCHPRFEGVGLQESSLSLPDATLEENGYTPRAYRDALISMLRNARQSMPHSQVFWYMNFFAQRQTYLREIAAVAVDEEVAMGGPDILPDNRPLSKNTYPLYKQFKGKLILFNSIQHDSYAHVKTTVPGAGKQYWTMEELFEFARDQLHVNYIFWNHRTWQKPADAYSWPDAAAVIEANPVFNGETAVTSPVTLPGGGKTSKNN